MDDGEEGDIGPFAHLTDFGFQVGDEMHRMMALRIYMWKVWRASLPNTIIFLSHMVAVRQFSPSFDWYCPTSIVTMHPILSPGSP